MVAWDTIVKVQSVIVDTGFTGKLWLTPPLASELGLNIVGVTLVKMADGKTSPISIANIFVTLEKSLKLVPVFVSEGAPLLGMGLLSEFGCRAIIDCPSQSVEIIEK